MPEFVTTWMNNKEKSSDKIGNFIKRTIFFIFSIIFESLNNK
jgi:hypothetical protein